MNRHQRAGRARRSADGRDGQPASGKWVVAALAMVAIGAVACSNSSAAPTPSYSGRYQGIGGAEVPKVAFTVSGNRVVGFTTDVLAACTFADGGTAERVLTLPDPNTITTHVRPDFPVVHDLSDTYTAPGVAGAVIQVTVVGHLLGGRYAYGTVAVSTVQGLQPGCRTPTGPAGWSLLRVGKSAAGTASSSAALPAPPATSVGATASDVGTGGSSTPAFHRPASGDP